MSVSSPAGGERTDDLAVTALQPHLVARVLGEGHRHLPAAIGVALVMRHGPQGRRQVFRRVGAVILGGEGDGRRLTAAVASDLERRRQFRRREVVASALRRIERLYRHQRRAAARAVLGRIEALATEGVGYIVRHKQPRTAQRVLVLQPLLLAECRVEGRRDLGGPLAVAHQIRTALREQFLVGRADAARVVRRLVQRRVRVV